MSTNGAQGEAEFPGKIALLIFAIDNFAEFEELLGDACAREIFDTTDARIRREVAGRGKVWHPATGRLALTITAQGPGDIRHLVNDIQASVAYSPVSTSFGPVAVSLAVGCALSAHGTDVEQMMPLACNAVRNAMMRGIGQTEIVCGKSALERDRLSLMATSRAAFGALDDQRLTIVFQPVVRAKSDHEICFHECLIRIRNLDGQLMAAGDFMPTIERMGLAPMIDRQVLAMAFETLANHPRERLSINIFPATMQDQGWLDIFASHARDTPELAERLIVEVTETAAMLDPRRTLTFMDLLRHAGTALAIDDFGSGHASFRYLRDFRFDIIKIDGHFVRHLAENADNQFFIQKMVEIARRFDMLSVAEYVQSQPDARILADLGVDCFQGYYYGAPGLCLSTGTDKKNSTGQICETR